MCIYLLLSNCSCAYRVHGAVPCIAGLHHMGAQGAFSALHPTHQCVVCSPWSSQPTRAAMTDMEHKEAFPALQQVRGLVV